MKFLIGRAWTHAGEMERLEDLSRAHPWAEGLEIGWDFIKNFCGNVFGVHGSVSAVASGRDDKQQETDKTKNPDARFLF